MAAPKKGRRPSGAKGRPGRALALILIAVVALTGGMFLSGHTTPRLGIDLAGGTSITLTAKNQPGQKNAINPTNMKTAVGIIERRVNGLGVSEAEVQTQGDRNIIVNIPRGTNEKQAREQVGTTAQLYFRPVMTIAEGKKTKTPQPSGNPTAPGKTSGKDKASPKASGGDKTAKDGKGTQPTPSAGATTQGRAVTSALKADTKPKPSPSGKAPVQPPSGQPQPPQPQPGAAIPPKLQKQLAALDCSKASARAGQAAKATDPTVACSKDGKAKYALGPADVQGVDVTDAKAGFDQQRGSGWLVQLSFNDKGTKKFADSTGKLASKQPPQNQFAIVLDGQVVSAPSVSTAITGGNAEISGSFTQQSAEDLANVLSYGALPLAFDESSVTTVSPALGGEQLQAGLIAGAIGLALVIAYLIVYYRGLSLVALLSLMMSAALTYTIMTLLGPAIGFALNLPAVCGAIVAIGITADSFIVFFERIRDEVREGRSLQPAVARGWPRARRTILVADFVSFLAAAVLFVATVGKVQGFAFTLGLTTLLDIVVVFLFTKPLMTILARRPFFGRGHPWSGLDPKRLGAKPPLRRGRPRNRAVPTDPKEA